MYLKPKDRQLIKNCLLITNMLLAAILLGLLFIVMLIIRPKLIDRATNVGQFLSLDFNHLPQSLDTIEPDDLGKENKQNLVPGQFKQVSHEREVMTDFSNSRPKIAILLTNVGLNKRLDDFVLTLPSQISLGVLPYSNRTNSFLQGAQMKGYEIYLYLPLYEGNNLQSLEKNLLNPNFGVEENTVLLSNILNIYRNYKVVYSNLKEIFTINAQAFQPLLEQIENKNLIFVLGRVNNLFSQEQILQGRNIIQTSLVIDPEADEIEIKKDLEKLIENAQKNNSALGYVQGYMLTVELINKWLPTLKAKGIELVLVSHLLKEA